MLACWREKRAPCYPVTPPVNRSLTAGAFPWSCSFDVLVPYGHDDVFDGKQSEQHAVSREPTILFAPANKQAQQQWHDIFFLDSQNSLSFVLTSDNKTNHVLQDLSHDRHLPVTLRGEVAIAGSKVASLILFNIGAGSS